ncbi:hypothetical protein [Salegentibacter mishustinae]|uniref:hypothetical protein n=1 Tax=Salegentibacter mishustinae TaxID=270918 RepID=UPI00248FC423|nr:hypothetical protein [Salegentibacter mishustinae]
MINLKLKKQKLNSKEIMIEIMEDIEKINLGRFNKKYPVSKTQCTNAITVSIKQTCKRLGIELDCEVPLQFSEKLKKQYDKKYGGIVDFIVTPTVGPKVAIELDSKNKRLSYAKLEELTKRGYICYWLRYKINKTGRPYKSFYKADCSEHYRKLGFDNTDVRIIEHIFHPTPSKPLC